MILQRTIIFSAGVVVGAGAAVLALKDHYARKTEEEIEAVKESFYNPESETDMDILEALKGFHEELSEEDIIENDPVGTVTIPQKDTTKTPYGAMARSKGAEALARAVAKNNYAPAETAENAKVYTIPPEIFASVDGYTKVTLDYYDGNQTLVDISKEQIVQVDQTTGTDALTRFGEYGEEDVVYVRNESTGTDYEVCRVEGDMTDIQKAYPDISYAD